MLPYHNHILNIGAYENEEYTSQLTKLVELISKGLTECCRPGPVKNLDDLSQQIFSIKLGERSEENVTLVLEKISKLLFENAIITQHPNCIAHLHAPPLVYGVLAEHLIAVQNLSMDSWDQSGIATLIEQHVVNWLCEKLSLKDHSDGVFTSGGTQNNIMGLMLARDWYCENKLQHRVSTFGLPHEFQTLKIICSEKSHFSVQKAAKILGLGQSAIEKVKCNMDGTICLHNLNETVNKLVCEGSRPFAIVGTAGTTDHGAIDDLLGLASIADTHGIWLHVDAAYGGALIISSQAKRLNGIELADSIGLDFHKLWLQPISCSALLLKNKQDFRYLLHHSEYLNREDDEWPNLVDRTVSTTRRFDALKLFLTLQAIGETEYGKIVDKLLFLTQLMATAIKSNKSFDLLVEPQLTTILFRFKFETDDYSDQMHKELRRSLLRRGIAIIGETYVEGSVALKMTIMNPSLNEGQIAKLLLEIEQQALATVRGFLPERQVVTA